MKKLNVRYIIKLVFLTTLGIVVYLSLEKFHNTRCNTIDIHIVDSSEVRFIDKNEVLKLIHDTIHEIQGYKMDSIDINKLHNVLITNPYIRKAAIYKTVSGTLKIDIQQRRPMLLVIGDNQSYYIDNDGCIFATTKYYHPKIIVATGFIKDKFDFTKQPVYQLDWKTNSTVSDLFRLSKLIKDDDFWTDQIEQIYVTSLGEYELIPMIGQQILEIGDINNYDHKMYILKKFYFQAINKIGWNKYKKLSVKYNGQIICKRN